MMTTKELSLKIMTLCQENNASMLLFLTTSESISTIGCGNRDLIKKAIIQVLETSPDTLLIMRDVLNTLLMKELNNPEEYSREKTDDELIDEYLKNKKQ